MILIKKYAAEKVLAKVEEDYVPIALERLKILMRDTNPVVSAAAAESMVSIINRYPENEIATDTLKQLFENEEETVRIDTIKSLSEIELSRDIFAIISPCIRNLIHDKILVKKSLAEGLAKIGETSEDIVDLLENLIHDPFEDVNKTAMSSVVSLASRDSRKAKEILTNNINVLETLAHDPSEDIKRKAIEGLDLVSRSRRRDKTTREARNILEKLEKDPSLRSIIEEVKAKTKTKAPERIGGNKIADFFEKLSSGSDKIKLHLLHYEDKRNVEIKTETQGVIEIRTEKVFFKAMTHEGINDATGVEIKHIDGYTVKARTTRHEGHFCKTETEDYKTKTKKSSPVVIWDTGELKICYFLSEEGYKAAKEIEEDVKNKSIEVRQGGKSEYRRLEDIYNEINGSIEEKYKDYSGKDKDLKIAAESKSYMWIIKRWARDGRKLDLDAISGVNTTTTKQDIL
ncbi:MAG: HEAT repeat domain-containing protein [archaeon]|nr:HEAT repeat domain-containing protein [archaeon]